MNPARAPIASLVIGNTIAEMARVVEFADRFGRDNGIPQSVVNELNICLDELLNNTISYGYTDQQAHSIAVELSLTEGLLTAEIRDDGQPFDPRAPTPKATGKSLSTRKLGGAGLHFVKQLMDGLSYRREAETNVVRISKKLRGATVHGNR